jgi:site-specific DNA recombinase
VADLSAALKTFSVNPDHRVWAYLRVSSARQDDGEGLSMQRQAVNDYCDRRGLSSPVFIEEVASATKPLFSTRLPGSEQPSEESPRPILVSMLSHVSNIQDSHVVFWKLDRLARETMDQEMILRFLWSRGVSVHSTDPGEQSTLGDKSGDPQRTLLRTLLAAFGQYEASIIRARMDAGMLNKAAKGEWTGGKPPFGYESYKGDLRIREYESKVVRYVFNLYRNHGMSMRAIAGYLQTHKPGHDPNSYYHQRIQRIIKNEPLYRGGFVDRYGNHHRRDDWRILPETDDELAYQVEEETSRGRADEPG